MIFVSLVLAPLVRSRRAAPEFMALFLSAARRFRYVVWSAMALLLSTGPLLLYRSSASLFDPARWPEILRVKLGLVAALVLLSLVHDLMLGPQIRKITAIPEGVRSTWDRTILRTSVLVPRLALLLALGVLFAAVMLARI